jgi:hypothetical protein
MLGSCLVEELMHRSIVPKATQNEPATGDAVSVIGQRLDREPPGRNKKAVSDVMTIAVGSGSWFERIRQY